MASVVNSLQSLQATTLQAFAPQSSWISLLEYDPVNLRLTVHLKDNSIYQHTFVTGPEWTALQTAHNVASHWSRNIKGKKASIRLKVKRSSKPKRRLK